ncbi:phospholipid:diacylglycerol acyltransferase [Rhizina undulata]
MFTTSTQKPLPPSSPTSSTSKPPESAPIETQEDTTDVSEKENGGDRLAEKVTPPTVVKRTKKRSFGFVFVIGGLVGIILAGFLAKNQDMVGLELSELLPDLKLDALVDVIPAGILKEAKDISARETEAVGYDAFSVGLQLKTEGLVANHSVIMIPGVISTGLESWGTEEKSRMYFRKRLWGSWSMLRAMVTDRATWKQHVMLDKETGLDPPGIKLRAAQGFDATDFFVTGYWIWNKIIENLASIGYDPASAYTASYDWRLSYNNLETRDHYFSRLKMYIETANKVSGKKVTLIAHSMGSPVALYFFKWVEAEGYGNGGLRWVDDNIDAFINISGCLLGAVKGLPAVLSGEMKDTAQLNQFAVYGLEKFFSKEDRTEILRAMPGISSMLPKGGDAVWGNLTWAPDDEPGQSPSYGSFIKFVGNDTKSSNGNLTVEGGMKFLLENSDDWFRRQVERNWSHGVAWTREEVERNEKVPRTWVNPLESRLPFAPSLKIYCFYGIGKPTERSYYYRDLDETSSLNISIDTSINGYGSDHGVVVGEGDGTVPLLSAGYMCAKGWKMKRYNPAGIEVKIYEMPHDPDRFDIRGGPNTGDHVDILGRQKLNELILRVAAGRGDSIKEHIESRILEFSEKVAIHDDENMVVDEIPIENVKESEITDEIVLENENHEESRSEAVEGASEPVDADISNLNSAIENGNESETTNEIERENENHEVSGSVPVYVRGTPEPVDGDFENLENIAVLTDQESENAYVGHDEL